MRVCRRKSILVHQRNQYFSHRFLGAILLDRLLKDSSGRRYKIARSYVSRIENGVARNPSKDKLIGLAKGLECRKNPDASGFAVARGKPFWSAGTCHRFF